MQPHYTFHHELLKLNRMILKISTMAEERVRRAATVIQTQDQDEIQSIISSDYEIDEMEVEIEEECLKILALHQPVAGDLRFIITVIKINNEIERIADKAVGIAMRVDAISSSRPMKVDFDFKVMAEKTITMLRMSLDALVERNAAKARKVFLIDDEIDAMKKEAYNAIVNILPENSEQTNTIVNNYLLAGHLERIADRATNIAEEVVYLVEGTIVRVS